MTEHANLNHRGPHWKFLCNENFDILKVLQHGKTMKVNNKN